MKNRKTLRDGEIKKLKEENKTLRGCRPALCIGTERKEGRKPYPHEPFVGSVKRRGRGRKLASIDEGED